MSGSAAVGRPAHSLSARQRRQIAALTAAAVLVWLGFRFLARPPALSPMDFVAGGADALQFCDPNHPQFLPVVTRSQPVVLQTASPGRVVLTTATGKPVGPHDLVPTDGVPLRLFIVDRTLMQFLPTDAQPGGRAGEWLLRSDHLPPSSFRIFADLTPAATGREIYASADLSAAGAASSGPAALAAGVDPEWRFTLESLPARIYGLQPVSLTLIAERRDGMPARLIPIGGSRAHLIAFDQACTGMVHLRSREADASPDGQPKAEATFQVTFPDSGAYVLWAELNLNGRSVLERFPREVVP